MSDNPTFKKVDPRQYHRLGVPMALQQAVRVLNEALKIDAGAVTVALETGVEIKGEALRGFLNHPSIVIRAGEEGKRALSGLGLLNGALMTKRFRLYVEFEDEDKQYKKFGIYEVLSS
jgi:hypothetical protein